MAMKNIPPWLHSSFEVGGNEGGGREEADEEERERQEDI